MKRYKKPGLLVAGFFLALTLNFALAYLYLQAGRWPPSYYLYGYLIGTSSLFSTMFHKALFR